MISDVRYGVLYVVHTVLREYLTVMRGSVTQTIRSNCRSLTVSFGQHRQIRIMDATALGSTSIRDHGQYS